MIKNEREYRITRTQARALDEALTKAKAVPRAHDVHPRLWKAQQDALASQLDELHHDIAEYDSLRSGTHPAITVSSFEELPQALVQARIAAGLSQKELAERLGVKEQQIQRYEATDYTGASLARLQEITAALGIQIEKEIFLPTKTLTPAWLFTRLRRLGIDRNLQLRLLRPYDAELLEATGDDSTTAESTLRRVAGTLGRVFDIDPIALLTSVMPVIPPVQISHARFKTPSKINSRTINAYARYAQYLAELVARSTQALPQSRPPNDPNVLRAALSSVTFDRLLEYSWSLGVPILPLSHAGGFHAACFLSHERWVVVLKQRTAFPARWEHDLIHELGHLSDPATQADHLDLTENPFQQRSHPDEQRATAYASSVLLGGQEEALVQECVTAASGSVERLKETLPSVAQRHHVNADHLANYLAFRLSMQGINWWGAATNLQRHGDPYRQTRQTLLAHIDFTTLNDEERFLLSNALLEPTS